MTEVASRRAAHHQEQTIDHLRYENDLLLRRNELLAQENSKLLQELEQAMQRIAKSEIQKAEKMANEQKQLFQKAKLDCAALFHEIDRKMERLIGGQVAAYKESLNTDCSIEQLYDCLTKIIVRLLDDKSEEREEQLRELISTTEGRLTKRRQAR